VWEVVFRSLRLGRLSCDEPTNALEPPRHALAQWEGGRGCDTTEVLSRESEPSRVYFFLVCLLPTCPIDFVSQCTVQYHHLLLQKGLDLASNAGSPPQWLPKRPTRHPVLPMLRLLNTHHHPRPYSKLYSKAEESQNMLALHYSTVHLKDGGVGDCGGGSCWGVISAPSRGQRAGAERSDMAERARKGIASTRTVTHPTRVLGPRPLHHSHTAPQSSGTASLCHATVHAPGSLPFIVPPPTCRIPRGGPKATCSWNVTLEAERAPLQ
jgi:hypothetical protein